MPRNQTKRNPLIGLLILLILIISLSFATVFVLWKSYNNPVDPQNTKAIRIVIPKGYGSSQIADLLKQKNLIKNSLAFRIKVKQLNLGNKLQAGSYQISPSQNLEKIVSSLTSGKTEEFWVTIPEGKRLEEIAKILADEFSDNDLQFSIPDFLDLTEGQEGYIFPETYLFPKTATTELVVQTLQNTFEKKTSELKQQAKNLDYSWDEIINIASMVEREAKFKQDRPKVARVFLNRLDIGMGLQIDATIQYSMGTAACSSSIGKECDWWPTVFDTSYQSKYNTYQNPGLPPTPISNPGLAAIEAVVTAPDHNYLYYLSEDDGTTYYSKTLEDHQDKVQKYLR